MNTQITQKHLSIDKVWWTERLIRVYVAYKTPQPQEMLFVHIREIRGDVLVALKV